VEVRQLGQATGGIVDPSSSKSIGLLVFIGVFAVWCWIVLFASRTRANLRAAKQGGADDLFGDPHQPFPTIAAPSVTNDFVRFAPPADGLATNADASAHSIDREWATTRLKSGS
jgi:hypothetical protein